MENDKKVFIWFSHFFRNGVSLCGRWAFRQKPDISEIDYISKPVPLCDKCQDIMDKEIGGIINALFGDKIRNEGSLFK